VETGNPTRNSHRVINSPGNLTKRAYRRTTPSHVTPEVGEERNRIGDATQRITDYCSSTTSRTPNDYDLELQLHTTLPELTHPVVEPKVGGRLQDFLAAMGHTFRRPMADKHHQERVPVQLKADTTDDSRTGSSHLSSTACRSSTGSHRHTFPDDTRILLTHLSGPQEIFRRDENDTTYQTETPQIPTVRLQTDYQWRVLPFEIAGAPWLFTRLTTPIEG